VIFRCNLEAQTYEIRVAAAKSLSAFIGTAASTHEASCKDSPTPREASANPTGELGASSAHDVPEAAGLADASRGVGESLHEASCVEAAVPMKALKLLAAATRISYV
jgi:hypothetical protein